MNEFIVTLKKELNGDIERYLEKRGILISFFDGIMPDTLIVQTILTECELNELEYIEEAKKPRIGRI